MSSIYRALLGIAAGAAALTFTPQNVEAGTVVASSGPSAGTYPVGTQISDTQRITLRAGDVVTVLDGGSTRVLRGPGTYLLGERRGASGNRALAGLTARRGQTQARTGTVRGVEGSEEVRNPNIWYVDVSASGTICLADMASVNLWRGNTNGAATYTVAPSDSPDDAVRASFPDLQMLAQWDAALQLEDGATYTLASETTGEETQVTFVLLEDAPDDAESLAQAFISNGCTVQLDQIITAAQSGD